MIVIILICKIFFLIWESWKNRIVQIQNIAVDRGADRCPGAQQDVFVFFFPFFSSLIFILI